MTEDWSVFQAAFVESIAAIEACYFEIQRYETPSAWRERAYCYELYHQLRLRLPSDFPYVVHGEIDKRKQHNVCQHFEGIPNPDFVVHIPGEDRNLAVVEVKRSDCRARDARNDLHKLNIFIDSVGYYCGIFLLFGPHKRHSFEVPNQRIAVLEHTEIGQAPVILHSAAEWNR